MNDIRTGIPAVLCAALLTITAAGRGPAPKTLEVMVGSAASPPVKEIVKLFEKKTGARVEAHYGGSGSLLSQIEVAGRGDVYFPGSSDFMDKAVAHGVVKAGAPKVIVYLVPAIIVPKSNPRHIESLKDLARPGVRVGIGRPDSVCVGLYGVQILAEQGLLKAVRPNIVTQAESCAKTCSVASLGLVDAVLGWRAFQFWDPGRLKAVMLPPAQVGRIATMTAAPTRYAKDKALAGEFVDFLRSDPARAIFRKWGYLPTLKEARAFTLPDTPVGGTAPLPKGWEGGS